MTALRIVVVLVTWPFVNFADRLRGVDPPASLRVGLGWARGELRYGRPTAGRGRSAVTAPRRVAPARVLAALDVLGWPDDREGSCDGGFTPRGEYYGLAEDVVRAADEAAGEGGEQR